MNRKLRQYVRQNCIDLETSAQRLQDIYEITFRSNADAVMVEYEDDHVPEQRTYAEIRDMAERIAAGLYARLGATHGYVGLEMENCVEWIPAFWGILRSGNRPYLINCRHPEALSARILAHLGITAVVGLSPTKLPADYLDVRALLQQPAAELPEVFEDEFAISTSATSLQETVCFYNGAAIARQILDARQILQDCKRMASFYHGRLKQLAFLPFYHIFGLFAVYFWFSFFGRTFVFLPSYSPEAILRTVRSHEVTHIFAVPLLWHTVEDRLRRELKKRGPRDQKKLDRGVKLCTRLQDLAPETGIRLSKRIMKQVTRELFGPSVQFCISGGSYLRTSALELLGGIGYPLYNGYGTSETGITSVELRTRPKYRNRNSVGRPLASVGYRIGPEGTLQCSGASRSFALMVGGERSETPQWLDSGDLAECVDGDYYIRGRLSDLVIGENGENVNPDEIERELRLPGAERLSVLGIPEGENDVLSLVVQISPFLPAAALRRLMAEAERCNGALPSAARIRRMYLTGDPICAETAIKVSRKYLLRGLKDGSIRLTPFAAATAAEDGAVDNPVLSGQVREIIAKVLGIDPGQIGEDDHLMQTLDCSSLEYFEIAARLEETFRVPLLDGRTPQCSTVRELCRYLEKEMTE